MDGEALGDQPASKVLNVFLGQSESVAEFLRCEPLVIVRCVLVLLLCQQLIKLRLLGRRLAEDNAHVLHRHGRSNGAAVEIGMRARYERPTQPDGTGVVDRTHNAALQGLLCDS